MAIKNLQLINRAVEVDDSRQRDHNDKVAQLLNSLLRNGSIFQSSTNPPAWSIATSGGTNYTPPDNAAYTWVNQQAATITSYMNTSVLASANGGPGTDSVTARVQTVPSRPYTLVAALKFSVMLGTDLRVGVLWRDSVSGKIETFGPRVDATSGASVWDWTKWTNPTTFSAHRFVGQPFQVTDPIWLKLQDDNANRWVSVSPNGHDWQAATFVASNDFFLPNQIGFGMVTPATGGFITTSLLSWLTTQP